MAESATNQSGGERELHETLHGDGSVWGRGHLVNGAMHGRWEFFRKDGTLMRSGSFDRDGQVGEWVSYDKSGDPSKVTQFGP
jgi:antitoxin component YwqK of YwqJK toxin-antitoxin module